MKSKIKRYFAKLTTMFCVLILVKSTTTIEFDFKSTMATSIIDQSFRGHIVDTTNLLANFIGTDTSSFIGKALLFGVPEILGSIAMKGIGIIAKNSSVWMPKSPWIAFLSAGSAIAAYRATHKEEAQTLLDRIRHDTTDRLWLQNALSKDYYALKVNYENKIKRFIALDLQIINGIDLNKFENNRTIILSNPECKHKEESCKCKEIKIEDLFAKENINKYKITMLDQ
jgi:hypothetical protein